MPRKGSAPAHGQPSEQQFTDRHNAGDPLPIILAAIAGAPPAAPPPHPLVIFNQRLPAWALWIVRPLGWALAALATLTLLVSVLVGIALAVAYPNVPSISSLTDYRPKLPLKVFSSDGVLLGEYGDERRSFVPIAQIPKVMKDAVLAIEDSRFYDHGGVDYIGMLRAGMAQFSDARSQGASTITMQVARKSISRLRRPSRARFMKCC